MNYIQNEKIDQVTNLTMVFVPNIEGRIHWARGFDNGRFELAKQDFKTRLKDFILLDIE